MTYAQHFLREPFPLLPDDSRFESQPGLQVLWCPGRKYFYLLCLFFYILSIVLRLFPLVYFDIKNFFLLKCCSYGLRLIEVSNLFPNRPNSLETSLLKATYGSSHKDHCTPEETHSSGLDCVLSLKSPHGQPRERQEKGIMPILPEVHITTPLTLSDSSSQSQIQNRKPI